MIGLRAAGAVFLGALVLGFSQNAVAAGGNPAFDRSAYNRPEVTDDSAGTLLRADARPAGLKYSTALDPARSYRVRVRGATVARGIVLRITEDGRHRYTRAPNGVAVFRTSGTSSLELLFFRHYEEDDVEYRIHQVAASVCGDCPGDAALTTRVLADAPAVGEALAAGDKLAAGVEIMRWAAPRIPVAGGDPPVQLPETPGMSAAELYYDHFEPEEAAVMCAGASDFLVKLLHLFEIPAFALSFGDPNLYTHAVVIVPVPGAGGTDWYMLDPTFSAFLRLQSGVALPLFEALEAWRAGRGNLIEVDSGGLEPRRVLVDPRGVESALRCGSNATSGWSGCGTANLAHDWDAAFDAAGHGRGYGALLSLLARTKLFYEDALGVPQEFSDTWRKLHEAIASERDDVYVRGLPLPPRSLSAPLLSTVHPVLGERLTVGAGAWDFDPGRQGAGSQRADPAGLEIRWRRCRGECTPVPDARGPEYRVTRADIGSRLVAAVSASNRWGRGDWALSSGSGVVAGTRRSALPRRAGVSRAVLRLRSRGGWRRVAARVRLAWPQDAEVQVVFRRRGRTRVLVRRHAVRGERTKTLRRNARLPAGRLILRVRPLEPGNRHWTTLAARTIPRPRN